MRLKMKLVLPPLNDLSAKKLALIGLIALAALCFLNRTVTGSGTGDDDKKATATRYEDLILKSYDLRFGPNPFAPGNATSTTGTFIPGEMFISSKRCATCHTDAHAQWRQSA